MTAEVELGHSKQAFGGRSVEFVVLENLQELSQVEKVLMEISREYDQIVKVYNDPLVEMLCKDLVHVTLEGRRSVYSSKGHHKELIFSLSSVKSRLVLMFCGNRYLPESGRQIELAEILAPMESVQAVLYPREGITVLDSASI